VVKKSSINVCALAVGTLVLTAASLAATIEGCSSSSGDGSGPGTGSGPGGGDTGAPKGDAGGTSADAGSATCSGKDDIFTIAFSPMYSAVIPGDNTHTFAIPAIVSGVSTSAVTWSASTDTVVLAEDPSTGGILITMSDTGSGGAVTITAHAGGSCGNSTLNITPSTIAAWNAGNSRYNDASVPFDGLHFGGQAAPDGGFRYACTACHAEHGADAGAGTGFNDVAHTPEQAGGFSDQQLLDIIQNGQVPGYDDAGVASADAGYFDPSIVPYQAWHHFHRWGLTTEEQAGIVTYLRSLTPTAQSGASNFGGYQPGDGGFHHHHDGGGGPPPSMDAGSAPADAGTKG
jgi:hypothetical protein